MIAYLISFAAAVPLGIVLTFLVRKIGRRLRIVDQPDDLRKRHERAVPRVGGVAVFLAFLLATLLARRVCAAIFHDAAFRSEPVWPLFGGALVVVAIGLWDDVKGIRARWKLLLLAAVSLGMYFAGYRITSATCPCSGSVVLGRWTAPVTIFWFLGCMNAVNLIDGLDGLAGGVTLFACVTIFVAGTMLDTASAMIASLALAGVLVGFLVYNFHPASIFLGDCGSYLLGFVIACQGLRGNQKANTVFALLIPLIALGLPVIDTTLAIIRRWSQGLSLFTSDREHIHHRLLQAGYNQRQTVLMMYGICVLLAAAALLTAAMNDRRAAALVLALGAAAVLIVRAVGRAEIKRLKHRVGRYLANWRRAQQIKTAGHEAVQRIRHAETMEAVWNGFALSAAGLDLDRADLLIRLPHSWPDGQAKRFSWSRDDGRPQDAGLETWAMTLPLRNGDREVGEFTVTHRTRGECFASAMPETLDAVGREIAGSLDRVAAVGPRGLQRGEDAGLATRSAAAN